MRKVILLSLAAIMLLSGAVMATETRIASLGYYTAPYICDDANVYTWYATLPSYANLVMMTMWNYGEYEATPEGIYAMTYALGEEGKYGTLGMGFMEWGFHPNPNYGFAYQIWDGSWDDYDAPNFDEWDDYIDGVEQKYTVTYAYKMEKMSFGLFFDRSSVKYKYTEEDDTPYEEEGTGASTKFGIGFRMDLTDAMTLDLAGDYTKVTDTYTIKDDEADEEKTELDPGKVMSFRGRMFWEYNEEITFVPYVSYTSRDFAYKPVDEIYSDEGFGYKDMEMTFGIGANMTVNEDAMIVFAVEPFSYWKAEPSGYTDGYEESWEVNYKVMPRFILALESDLTDWLTFRTGCSKDLGKTSWKWQDEDDTQEESRTYDLDNFAWNIGVGFHFGDFDIDCLLNKSVPFKMGYWLTGMQERDYYGYPYGNGDSDSGSDTPICMISALYHF